MSDNRKPHSEFPQQALDQSGKIVARDQGAVPIKGIPERVPG